MKLHTDHHFRIGHAHLAAGKPCQDYAISATYDGGAYAIVADGCSSGGHTDVGARLVAHMEARQILTGAALDFAALQDMLMLAADDMLATSVTAQCTPDGCTVRVIGDGVFAVVHRNGDLDLEQVSWTENTPYYPAYRGERLERFVALHTGRDDALRHEAHRFRNGARSSSITRLDVHAGLCGVQRHIDGAALEDIACIAVLTDGVTQVPGIDWVDAAQRLTAFKSTAGRFAVRRLNRFVRDANAARGGPADDIAVAVIRLEHTT